MRKINNIFNLGLKELISLKNDKVLIAFLVYGFTFLIFTAAQNQALELRNASIAIADEDNSVLSYRIRAAFMEPYFSHPGIITVRDIDKNLEQGNYTFVVNIPPDFQKDILAGNIPDMQINVDATAISQATIGANYINTIIEEETRSFLVNSFSQYTSPPVTLSTRILFNPNLHGEWFMSVMVMINIMTLIAILTSGAAIIRERENDTIDHLLVMPLTPFEIVSAKFWANALVIVTAVLISLTLVIQYLLKVETQGSLALFIAGVVLYLFSTISIGIFLATVARSMQQLGLLSILIVFPMLMLSGGYTPLDAMPKIIDLLTIISPTRHFVSFAQAVLFRGAGIDIVLWELIAVGMIGGFFYITALYRFRNAIIFKER